MLRFEQLDLLFSDLGRETIAATASMRDAGLEAHARQMLQTFDAKKLCSRLRVEWNPRLRTAAGRADSHRHIVSLNPRLRDHGEAEIERTLRHELAHLLAHHRAGRRRISPHGREWRQACSDLGIADEKRCHSLPFPTRHPHRRFLYRCPNCAQIFPRVRKIRRTVACLTCCRRYNKGNFATRFQLYVVSVKNAAKFSGAHP